MKRKIILSFLAVFLISALGSAFATLYIRNTTIALNRLFNLHQVEDLHHQLVMAVQEAQSNLLAVPVTPGREQQEALKKNADSLGQMSGKCSSCHHEPVAGRQISRTQSLIGDYQKALSLVALNGADARQANRRKLDAAVTGKALLGRAEWMSVQASRKLESTTQDAMSKIRWAWLILAGTMIVTLTLGAVAAVTLSRTITRPINTLVNATRMITSGSLGYTIESRDTTEFGELASHFNAMSMSLKNGYAALQAEISERQQTASALAKLEAFLKTIFDSIRDPFCIIDRDYHIVRANEAYARIKNRKLADLIGTICYETLQNRSAICDGCIVEKTFVSGNPSAEEKRQVLSDGTNAWRAIYTYPIVESDGGVSHVIEYTKDITARKQAEDALRESEERYALAARGANDGLWDWDLRSNKIHFSVRWKSMLGYEESEIGDKPEEWLSRVHPDDHDEVETRIAAHLNGRNPHFECEYRVRHKDGVYRWVISRGLAVRNEEGQAYRMAGSQTDITARKKAEEQLVYDAFHDTLTGLPNRALFLDRLQHVITATQRRAGALYAVLFLDMDRFKIINDSLGHAIGDQLLIAVGRKLSDCIRPGDTVARLGGDEFAVLLEEINEPAHATDVAERIQKKLTDPIKIKSRELFTSVSIGIALGAERYERPEQVLRDADIAMYEAKARGNSFYEVFDSKMHANVLDRLQLEADLRGALDHREFVLYYQPIIDLEAQRLTGFEALVRWNHPKRGLIYPMEFIPLAEENGLIVPIGEWILHEACSGLKLLQERYPAQPQLTMSINISSKQFVQKDLVSKLAGFLKETGVDPKCLALEITESMIMENVDAAVETMTQMRDMGIRIHIDDFGTGYSSLSYLHRFPVNALKIDRSFIKKLAADGSNKEIILSIISLAKSMNFDVIAEGVEMEHQLSKIKEMHCGFGQGFLFAHPMGMGDINRWLQNQKQPA
jgi:diguanylate cyclase (GGDEF)-like protein/PAS domain S-box-containing protein